MKRSDHADERHPDGLKLLNAGKPAEAEAIFREAVAACPQWVEAHTHLGLALAARGPHTDALTCFARAVGLNADDAVAHHHLANTLKRLGRPKDAIAHYPGGDSPQAVLGRGAQ